MASNSQQQPPAWANVLLERIQALEGLTQTLQARLDTREGHRHDRLPDVPTFDGSRKEYAAWAAQLRAKLQVDLEDDSEVVRFWYCHSRLRGKALSQVTPWVKSVGQQGTVSELCGQLDAAYDTREEVDNGERQMLVLQQKNRSFAVYYAEFERSLIAADGVLWPERVKRLFLESGFSKELRAALIPVEKPEKFEDYVAVVRRVAMDLERGRGKSQWSTDTGPYDIGMDWETAPEVRVASNGASGTHAKRVSKDVIEARKAKGLCLRCGNAGHRIRECTYLPPVGMEVSVFAARPDGSIGLNSGSRETRVNASRIRQIEEVLNELDSSDFDDDA